MNRVKQKLQNREGMSILIALVGFMVAAMVSIVIITQAVTSAKRVSTDKNTILNQRALVTAAEYVQQGIESTEYTFEDYTGTAPKKIDTAKAGSEGQYAVQMKNAVEYVDSNESDYISKDRSADFTVDLEATDASSGDAADPETVNVSFVMTGDTDGRYDVIFTFTISGSDQQLYLSVDGYCTNEKNADGKYRITWSGVSINGLGGET